MVDGAGRHFDDQVVVVTGSTRGIGAAVARQFAAGGARVVVAGRSREDGERVAEEILDRGNEASFVRTDVRDPDDVAALMSEAASRYGRLDVLVNNAAVQTATGAGEATMADWEAVVETGFRGYWLCAKRAIEHMDQGAIVNVSSNHASVTMPDCFPYNAVKAGVNGMTRAMALDFAPEVRVNGVAPGWVEVERTVGDMDAERRERLESIHPMDRMGRPEDVANAVQFLASDAAAFVTGETLVADGGRSAVMEDDRVD